jgi:XTP/dITP diphosphohydrolase
MELVVATRNAGKLKEIRRLLEEQGVVVLGLDQFPELPDVEEDGDTFAVNATKKAEEIARATGMPCLADDSGLTVAALDGRPGVYSARFSGEEATDSSNNHKLLVEMMTLSSGCLSSTAPWQSCLSMLKIVSAIVGRRYNKLLSSSLSSLL